jgi:hypothetical protein
MAVNKLLSPVFRDFVVWTIQRNETSKMAVDV